MPSVETVDRPLVTFALFAYNQEEYIRESVEAAFAQTYEPLEIILSDDCSTDRTFEIMREMVKKYAGRHKIILNKNGKNQGIAAHINTVMNLVSSEFVVVAAGDDISEPERTAELVGVWLSSSRQSLSIHSSVQDIDRSGKLTGNIRKGGSDESLNDLVTQASSNVWVLGAAHAWDMQLIRNFPPILKKVVNEDIVLPARAALLGRVQFVDKPLVRYRTNVGISFEVIRQREEGQFGLTLAQLRRPYYATLQKHRDFKFLGKDKNFKKYFNKTRSCFLYPLWLRCGKKRSKNKIIFFIKRVNFKLIIWEYIKYTFPSLVKIKQTLQFGFKTNN